MMLESKHACMTYPLQFSIRTSTVLFRTVENNLCEAPFVSGIENNTT